jgi:hypothetical protein
LNTLRSLCSRRWQSWRTRTRSRWSDRSPRTRAIDASDRARLGTSRTGLATLRQLLGDRFSQAGAQVTELADSSLQLVKAGEQLIQSASGSGSAGLVLQSTVEMLQAPLAFLDSCKTRIEAVILRLGHCDRQVVSILRLQDEWSTTVAPLKHIRTLCRIEAAVLPAELQTMFLAVTGDIERLEAQVGAMFAERFTVLRSMHDAIGGLVAHLRSVLPRQYARAEAKRAQILASLREVQEEVARNSTRDLRLTAATRGISAAVGRVVVGLQADDIIGQKIEHVRSALSEMCELASGDRLAPDRLAQLHHLALLQSAQLDTVAADIRQAESATVAGFDDALRHIGELDTSLLGLGDLNKVTVSGDGMVQILLDALGESEQLVGATVKEARDGYERMHPLGNAVSSLTATMVEVSVSMHLIALNAQIQAIRHGHGTGLEVLAARTAEISVGVTRIGSEALTSLQALAQAVRATIAEFDEVRREGDAHVARIHHEWKQHEHRLHDLRNRSLAEMHAIGTRSRELAANARRVAEEFRIVGATADLLADPQSSLRTIADLTEPFANSVLAPTAGDLGRRRYTMASERVVHAAVAAGTAAGTARETAPPQPAPAATTAAPPATTSSSVELF